MNFIIRSIPYPNWEVIIGDEPLFVGSGAENQLAPQHTTVSKQHAVLNIKEGTLLLTDLQSAEGSYVNGNRVQQAVLKPGDVIAFGKSQWTIEQLQVAEENIKPGVGSPVHRMGEQVQVESERKKLSKQKTWGIFWLILLAVSLITVSGAILINLKEPKLAEDPVIPSTIVVSTDIIVTITPQSTTNTPSPIPTDTMTITPTPTLGVGSTQISDVDGMVMVYVPAGDFLMGMTEKQATERKIALGDPNMEKSMIDPQIPSHTVYLDAYWIDKTEVTNAMFTKFVEETSYQTEAEKKGSAWIITNTKQGIGVNWMFPQGKNDTNNDLEQHPVVLVTWDDAYAYCEWAGRRLPTEAEWEKAARGTDGSKFPWGNQTWTGTLLNAADQSWANKKFGGVNWAGMNFNDNYVFTAPVGGFPIGISPYGVLDMLGNVSEWVADWYDETYYINSPKKNPTGPSSGNEHINRGGAFVNIDFWGIYVTDRNATNDTDSSVGFRCAQAAK